MGDLPAVSVTGYYDRRGDPLTLAEWGHLISSRLYKRVRFTELPGPPPVVVSTVWLGLDHRFGDAGAPLIFETMVFGGPHDSDCFRWSTELEADLGHTAVLIELGFRPPD